MSNVVVVRHSHTKPAWNIIGTRLGDRHKVACVPYIVTDDQDNASERLEALTNAQFIAACINYRDAVMAVLPSTALCRTRTTGIEE